MCQEIHYSPTTSLNRLHKAQLISVFNWDSSDQATCFQWSTVQFSKIVQIVASVFCSWQTGLDPVWSSAVVAHMLQGLMNWAFRDNLFHSLVVTSSYLTVWPFMKSNPSRSAISEILRPTRPHSVSLDASFFPLLWCCNLLPEYKKHLTFKFSAYMWLIILCILLICFPGLFNKSKLLDNDINESHRPKTHWLSSPNQRV